MNNNFIEELGNFWDCLSDEQLLCGAAERASFGSAAGMALARANFCTDCAADFCRSGHMNMVKMTAPKPLQDKALSKGGGAKRKPRAAFRRLYRCKHTSPCASS